MTDQLNEIIQDFQSMDDDFRLELLLDYAEKLPPLPEQYADARDTELNRVPECQTPVYLFVEIENNRVKILTDVAEESPTVRGLVSILAASLNNAVPEDAEKLPMDLIQRLGLSHKIGMVRVRGLSGIIQRIKNEVKEKTTHFSSN